MKDQPTDFLQQKAELIQALLEGGFDEQVKLIEEGVLSGLLYSDSKEKLDKVNAFLSFYHFSKNLSTIINSHMSVLEKLIALQKDVAEYSNENKYLEANKLEEFKKTIKTILREKVVVFE